MNCQEFNQVVCDLADANVTDAAKLDAAKAHAANCKSCESGLNNLLALSAGLKSLAATVENKEAPPKIEAALLSAFRQQTANPSLAFATADNLVSFPIRKRAMLLAAAAALLAIFAFAISHWLKDQPANQTVITLAPNASPTPANDPQTIVEKNLADNGSKPEPVVRKRIKHQSAKTQTESSSMDYSVTASLGELTPLTGNSFSSSEFLPLRFEPVAQPIESGQVIRVEMTRHALISFGLPINFEKADQPITADVLLAEDGSARAIRVVR